ncbi:MAG: trehalose-6-phosphate synthase, partial [Mycobacterium sp.]|nr:trehalose-6-phosphate synthase [Mycobacterium sp.]
MTPEGGPEAPSGTSGSAPPTASADFVVVANRLPIDRVRRPDGSTEWKQSPGGLVTALEPLLRKRRGAWIGWPGVPEEPGESDDQPIDQDGMTLVPVRLSATDVADYYEGFSNATLWPL